MIVIDSSIVLADVLEDEFSDTAHAVVCYVREEAIMALVPGHFPLEYTNGLLMAKRRKRLPAKDVPYVLVQWLHAPLEIDSDGQMKDILDLAEKHDLTVYDAAYLELAVRRKAPLATLDATLAKAAKKEKKLFTA